MRGKRERWLSAENNWCGKDRKRTCCNSVVDAEITGYQTIRGHIGLEILEEMKATESKTERLRREAEEAELQEQLMRDVERERQRLELVGRRLACKKIIRKGYLNVLAPYKITETKLDKIQNLSLAPAEATKLDSNLTYLTGWLDVKKRFAIRELGRQNMDLGDAPKNDDLNEIISKEFFENYRLCFRALQSRTRDILGATRRTSFALAAFHKVQRHHVPKLAR